MMEEKRLSAGGQIVNHNTNCQVFNGPISGSIFAMPGSHVVQNPVQQLSPDGTVTNHSEEAKADDDSLLVSVPDDLPVKILQAPERTIKPPHSTFVIRTLQEAGRACKDPWHYACLMAVCDDHGLLIDRTCYTDFARTLVAWGIVRFTTEKAISQLANSMRLTACKLPRGYRSWGSEWKKERDKCESLASCFGQGMPYRSER